ncbi:uncharacterized protein [Salvelinus alpinus]|uniref:uncharacterized protein n=1 Tax=Salvelinus alpinus TaxID=8036 RepID=UPI0039FCE1BB
MLVVILLWTATSTDGGAQVRLVDIQLTDDIITCSSTDIYPGPKLTWSTDPPSDLSFDPGTIQNSTSIKVDDQGLYDITSTKQFSRDRTNICTVTSGTIERTATLKQQDPVQGSPSSEVSIPCSVSQSDLLTFDLTWRFNQIVTILTSTYTKGTPQIKYKCQNENDRTVIPLQTGEEREEDIERQQQGEGEEGLATPTIVMP